MKVSLFVTGSATLLAVWLGVTFVQEIPAKSYQQLGKGSIPISAKVEKPAAGDRGIAAQQTSPPATPASPPAADRVPGVPEMAAVAH